MAYEEMAKRTLYVSECVCGDRREVTENPPKERLCPCGKWVPYKEVSYTGPKIGNKKT